MKKVTEQDILRFIVSMAEVRHDEDEVKQIIEDHLGLLHRDLHAVLLKVTLRVVVAQFYAPASARLDDELGYDFTSQAVDFQRCVNDGVDDDGLFVDGPPFDGAAGHRPEMDAALREILDSA